MQIRQVVRPGKKSWWDTRQRVPNFGGPGRTGVYGATSSNEAPDYRSASSSRSKNGVCASFNLRRASLSEKKQTRSTSGKLCILPECGGHSIVKMFERHVNWPGKFPSNAQA
jgi:hypothetical protein